MATTSLTAGSSNRTADAKISNDLAVLKEKMNLLDSMIHPTDASAPTLSVKTNEATRSVVGYLDACGPRMIELVTACMARDNVVSEEVLCDVLGCNDRLQNLLADVDTLLLTEMAASTTVGSAGVAAASSSAAASAVASSAAAAPDLTDQFGDLLLGNNDDDVDEDPFANSPAAASPAVAGAKTTGETTEDFADFKPAAAAAPAAAPPVPPPAPKDPFDDFFAERTESNF